MFAVKNSNLVHTQDPCSRTLTKPLNSHKLFISWFSEKEHLMLKNYKTGWLMNLRLP